MDTTPPQGTGRSRLLVPLYAALGLATVVACAVLAARSGTWPAVVPVVLFGVLMVWAENNDVRLSSDTHVSPSLMIVMAAIAAFDGKGTYFGAAAVGVCGGFVLDLVRRRKVGLIILNCAQFCLASVAAAAMYEVWEPIHVVLAIIAATIAFAAVNVAFILPAVVLEYRVTPRQVWADMAPAMPSYFAFAVLGVLVGVLYSSLGGVAVALLMTPVMIARAAFSSYMELVHAREATIKVFLRAIAAKDRYTALHTERVCRYSVYIGEKLGFSHSRLEHLRQAALMHDIGKLAVPGHLLNKPSKLTDDEFRLVQRHAHVCIDILERVDFLKPMIAAASGHHARYDGGGYGGVAEHPIEAYIVAVADAYDAMTSTRSYRRALPQEVAFEELRSKAGTQFHPEERHEEHGLGHEIDAVQFEVPPPVVGTGSAGLGDLVPSAAG
jgi:HD-GYP domain-containing protein (c-di-GMP phosphodiesterase class II)